MPRFTNKKNLPLLAAVWLGYDSYDHNPDPMTISATALLNSTRSIVLGSRLPPNEGEQDVYNLIASKWGTALHDSVEKAWRSDKLKDVLKSLGEAKGFYEAVSVNPEVPSGGVDLYFEVRKEKKVSDYTISGKFDAILDGRLYDLKSTKVYGYIKGNNTEKYCQQLSIYRWLNQDLVWEDQASIILFFKDWEAHMVHSKPGYPKDQIMEMNIQLMSIEETEAFITNKLADIFLCSNIPDEDLPLCTPGELWQNAPTYAYYSKPDAKRATKTFDDAASANMHCMQAGKGFVKERKGEPTKCKWCSSAPLCNQFSEHLRTGILKIT